jgi:hypothetical protein
LVQHDNGDNDNDDHKGSNCAVATTDIGSGETVNRDLVGGKVGEDTGPEAGKIPKGRFEWKGTEGRKSEAPGDTPKVISDKESRKEGLEGLIKRWGVGTGLREESDMPETNANKGPEEQDRLGPENTEEKESDEDVEGEGVVAIVGAVSELRLREELEGEWEFRWKAERGEAIGGEGEVVCEATDEREGRTATFGIADFAARSAGVSSVRSEWEGTYAWTAAAHMKLSAL